MTEIIVNRQPSKNSFTLGEVLWDGAHQCWSCEDVVREVAGQPVAAWKIPNETAVPQGRYRLTIDISDRFKRMMPHVLDVPGFTGIRIHIGNYAKDTDGCLLVGRGVTAAGVSESTRAFDEFYPKLEAALKLGEAWITYVNPVAVKT